MPSTLPLQDLAQRARQLYQDRRPAAAVEACLSMLAQAPQNVYALALLGQIALDQGDSETASEHYLAAWHADPGNPQHALDAAFSMISGNKFVAAQDLLQATVTQHAECHLAWMMLGQIGEAIGNNQLAQNGYRNAITRAQAMGIWCDEGSTPADQLETVLHAIKCMQKIRRASLFDSYEEIRQCHGSAALKRVDKALSTYLKEITADPPSAHQQPRFFYFPDLSHGPYHASTLLPWSTRLEDAWTDIRREALRELAQDGRFENYLRRTSKTDVQDHLRSDIGVPSWEAFFFYRRGERYAEHHLRCPITSQVLDSIDLCKIDSEAPEICFSVLKPGTEILPHHGVTNLRLVLHLPLLVPPNCALNVFGGGEHHWQEGKTVLFDDTYRHEAWNRSSQSRVILLMDCWNPYLSLPERDALQLLLKDIRLTSLANATMPDQR